MAQQFRFRKEDLLRAEYHGRTIFSRLYLVARKGEPVRTYEDKKDWLGRIKEVCNISETEVYQEDMYVTNWRKDFIERRKYEDMKPLSYYNDTDRFNFIVEDNIIYNKPYVSLYFKKDCGNSITIPFNKEEEALYYLDSLKEELPMLVVVKK